MLQNDRDNLELDKLQVEIRRSMAKPANSRQKNASSGKSPSGTRSRWGLVR
jgi:hypothetical protein